MDVNINGKTFYLHDGEEINITSKSGITKNLERFYIVITKKNSPNISPEIEEIEQGGSIIA